MGDFVPGLARSHQYKTRTELRGHGSKCTLIKVYSFLFFAIFKCYDFDSFSKVLCPSHNVHNTFWKGQRVHCDKTTYLKRDARGNYA